MVRRSANRIDFHLFPPRRHEHVFQETVSSLLFLSRIVVPARKEAFKLFNADESSQLLQVSRTRERAAS